MVKVGFDNSMFRREVELAFVRLIEKIEASDIVGARESDAMLYVNNIKEYILKNGGKRMGAKEILAASGMSFDSSSSIVVKSGATRAQSPLSAFMTREIISLYESKIVLIKRQLMSNKKSAEYSLKKKASRRKGGIQTWRRD